MIKKRNYERVKKFTEQITARNAISLGKDIVSAIDMADLDLERSPSLPCLLMLFSTSASSHSRLSAFDVGVENPYDGGRGISSFDSIFSLSSKSMVAIRKIH